MQVYDHTAILPCEYVEAFEKFLESNVHHGGAGGEGNTLIQRVDAILMELDSTVHYPVEVNLLSLLDFSQQLGTLLIHNPNALLPLFNEALLNVANRRLTESDDHHFMFAKELLHVRLVVPPTCDSVCKRNISSIRSRDVGGIVSVRGTVTRTGAVKMLEAEREYVCGKCQHRFKVFADLEMQNCSISPPTACPSTNHVKPCKSSVFNVDESVRVCRDYQEIKIQEHVEKLNMGSIPRSMVVVIEEDLADKCKPGDDVCITGVVTRRWKPFVKDARPDIEMVLKANHVRLKNEDKAALVLTEDLSTKFQAFWAEHAHHPLRARDHIVRSFCPGLSGLCKVKLSLLLTLIGGVPRVDGSGARTRGESHCLIIGDPGLGKSQLLKYVAKLSARAVLTTGVGTTSAGLTVTAQREAGGEWALEAGALVLADGGVCCIDEFDCTRESDRTAIHEAMEQQTISVAKAGLVCKLNTRCSVVAACNPKGKFDPEEDIAVNVALAAPLLSRFDLVLLLIDSQSEQRDQRVCSHVLDGDAARQERSRAPAGGGGAGLGALWDMGQLQAYVAWVKRTLEPRLTAEGERVLVQYYKLQRGAAERSAARTTVRMLESLVRIAQAHARLMFREEVTEQDALVAVCLVDACNHVRACGEEMHAGFPDDPEAESRAEAAAMLRRLFPSTGYDDSPSPSPSKRPRAGWRDALGGM